MSSTSLQELCKSYLSCQLIKLKFPTIMSPPSGKRTCSRRGWWLQVLMESIYKQEFLSAVWNEGRLRKAMISFTRHTLLPWATSNYVSVLTVRDAVLPNLGLIRPADVITPHSSCYALSLTNSLTLTMCEDHQMCTSNFSEDNTQLLWLWKAMLCIRPMIRSLFSRTPFTSIGSSVTDWTYLDVTPSIFLWLWYLHSSFSLTLSHGARRLDRKEYLVSYNHLVCGDSTVNANSRSVKGAAVEVERLYA